MVAVLRCDGRGMRVVCRPNLLTECTTGTSPSNSVLARGWPMVGSAGAGDSPNSCTTDISLSRRQLCCQYLQAVTCYTFTEYPS